MICCTIQLRNSLTTILDFPFSGTGTSMQCLSIMAISAPQDISSKPWNKSLRRLKWCSNTRAAHRTVTATAVLAKAGNGYGSAVAIAVVSSSTPRRFGTALSWPLQPCTASVCSSPTIIFNINPKGPRLFQAMLRGKTEELWWIDEDPYCTVAAAAVCLSLWLSCVTKPWESSRFIVWKCMKSRLVD